jgi:hypothetical protein
MTSWKNTQSGAEPNPLDNTQLVLPPSILQLDADERRAYLQRLFQMDIRLTSFVLVARSLGFAVTCRWDSEANMPELIWLH